MERLSLIEEEEAISLENNGQHHDDLNPALCLVGRFLTDRLIRVPIMKMRMAGVWHPVCGITISEAEPGVFLFQFYQQKDVERVLKQGPWSFDDHLLIIHALQAGETPAIAPLFKVPFWVQIHQLPVGFMNETVGQQLGNFVGTFLEYDTRNNANVLRPYMIVRVLLDVQRPLRRLKKIKLAGGALREVRFKYERLGPFCFYCGLLGHKEEFCASLFALDHDDGQRAWSAELRAEGRRSQGGGSEQWLRNVGQTAWVNPSQRTVNASDNCGHEPCSSKIAGVIVATVKEGESVKCTEVDMFTKPHLMFPKISQNGIGAGKSQELG